MDWNKINGIKKELQEYSKQYDYPNTADISIQFKDIASLFGILKDMFNGNYSSDERIELKNKIKIDLGVLESDLKILFEETPDQMTQDTLDKFDRYKNIFTL